MSIRKTASLALGLALLGAGAVQAQDPDPNLPAVTAVCGRCHGVGQFTDKAQSWDRWNDVFRNMSRLGATGTDEQLEQVSAYFLEHLTTLNVNTGSAEELAWVLGVTDGVAQQIVDQRQKKPFTSAAQLGALPGIDKARLEHLKPRLQF